MALNTSFQELSELIVEAIDNEPFFTKEVLIPKIKAILKGFNMRLSVISPLKEDKESEKSKRLIQINKEVMRANFWKSKCSQAAPEKMNEWYAESDKLGF